ncbi:unnamed protein product [Mesocestoides corti]|uniref:E3 ubiquitin-protein ligase CHFR cysteine rich domain-containing protein n=1 Tax=Mesocestoides corti TaxID=53468 RepID=A0A0R3U1G0_MESCO|nr:unnamed protein product [Mesocestoides corti]
MKLCRGKIRDYAKNCQLDAIVQEYLKSHPDYDLTSEEKSAIKEQIVEYEAQLHSQSAQPEAGHLMANGAVDEEEEEEEDEPTTCPWCPLTTSATGLPCSQHRTCFECGLLMPAPGVAEQLNLRDPGCALCKRDVCCLLANDDTPCRCDQHTCASSLNESRNHLPFHAKLINDVETAHLLTYKANKRLSEVDFVDAVLSRFASLTLHDFNDGLDVVALGSITPDTRLCRQCRDLCFSRLLYGWKMSLPPGDQRLWPSRPNCYYGYNCHTQHRSLQHAAKYNHCCPQTRFH